VALCCLFFNFLSNISVTHPAQNQFVGILLLAAYSIIDLFDFKFIIAAAIKLIKVAIGACMSWLSYSNSNMTYSTL